MFGRGRRALETEVRDLRTEICRLKSLTWQLAMAAGYVIVREPERLAHDRLEKPPVKKA